jgi:DNA-binding response OmpR family regulator
MPDSPNRGTIFIMDDDLSLQSMLAYALQQRGYTVETARDGREGLSRLETLQPRLVISDVMMPNMDGVELFNRLKGRLQEDGIPVIMMTALSRKPWFADLEAEGAVFLQKPFDIDRFVDMVEITLS